MLSISPKLRALQDHVDLPYMVKFLIHRLYRVGDMSMERLSDETNLFICDRVLREGKMCADRSTDRENNFVAISSQSF